MYEGHPEHKSRNTHSWTRPVRRYPSKWTRPRVYKTEFPTKEHIPGVGPRPSTSVKIREKKRRKRDEGKATNEGKRSLSQPIGIEGNPIEGSKPANQRSIPKLDFVQTKVDVFLKAVGRSEPTSPMGEYFATLTGHQTDEGDPWLRDITSEGPKSTKCHNDVANVETEVQAEGPGSPEVRAARRGEPLPFDRYNGAQRVASSFERPRGAQRRTSSFECYNGAQPDARAGSLGGEGRSEERRLEGTRREGSSYEGMTSEDGQAPELAGSQSPNENQKDEDFGNKGMKAMKARAPKPR